MSGEPIKWRYGAKLSRGDGWIWPRGCWEYEIEKAKAAARRTFPHSRMVGVEPLPPATGERWIHDQERGWCRDATPRESRSPQQVRQFEKDRQSSDAAPAPPVTGQWWQRD